MMTFTPQQRDAIELHGHLAVTAGAGSGKTRVLVERYLQLLVADGTADRLLAITFTEKAAREMRDRVRATLEARARVAPLAERAAWEELRARVEAARIGTIHSFCATLLRAHPVESGVDPQFSVLDEVESSFIIREAVEVALAQALATGHVLTPLLSEYGPAELRTLLTDFLRQGGAVEDALALLPATPAALVSQWSALTDTARYTAWQMMCATDAWQTATTTITQLAPHAPTNDGLAEQLRAVAAWLATIKEDDHYQGVAPLPSIRLNVGSKARWGQAEPLDAAKEALLVLRETYQTYKQLLSLTPDSALEMRAAQTLFGLATIYRLARSCYEQHKAQLAALDFDDLERHAAKLLRLAAVRTRWRSELRAVLVDEFQDTNGTQRDILFALVGTPSVPHHDAPALFIVGDGKQSIYRFRGAQVRVFRDVVTDVAQLGGHTIDLATSFRAHTQLVTWVNTVSKTLMQREGPLRPYETPFVPLIPHRPTAPFTPCVELHLVNAKTVGIQRELEAQVIAQRLKSLVAGDAGPLVYDERTQDWRCPRYGDIAMLFQASTVFDIYEAALRAAGIPFLTTAGRGFYGQKEIQDLINLLRLLDDPSDELALVGVLRSPLFALDDATIVALRFANPHSLWTALMHAERPVAACFARTTLQELIEQRSGSTTVELLRTALDRTGYMATISGLTYGERRRVNIEKFLAAARLTGTLGPGVFRDYLDQLVRSEPREGEAPLEAGDSVRLMTIHRSKGLEFPIVCLPDLGHQTRGQSEAWLIHPEAGMTIQLRSTVGEPARSVAYQLAHNEEQLMEEAERERLFYVALTRSRDYLLLSGPAPKRQGTTWMHRLISALGWSSDALPIPGNYGSYRIDCWDSDV